MRSHALPILLLAALLVAASAAMADDDDWWYEYGPGIEVLLPEPWPGAEIVIRYEGMPGYQQDWITLVNARAEDFVWGDWFYTEGAIDGQHAFPGQDVGEYEIRTYANWPDNGFTVLSRVNVTVTCQPLGYDPAQGTSLNLSRQVYKPDEDITVFWSGLPEHDDNWIALAKAGSPAEDRLDWTWLTSPTGSHSFSGLEPGAYEARLFFDWSGCGYVAQAVASFQVAGESPVGNNSLSMAKTRLMLLDPVVATYTAEGLSDDAWVGLMPSDTPHGSEVIGDTAAMQRKPLGSGMGKGSLHFTLPDEPGRYDLRMYDTDLEGLEVASVSFTVLGTGSVDIDKSEYAVGEEMTIRGKFPKPWYKGEVAVVRAESPHRDLDDLNDYQVRQRPANRITSSGGYAAIIEVPRQVGGYEVRLYHDKEELDAVGFTVTAENTLALDKDRYFLGQPIQVEWTAEHYTQDASVGDGSSCWVDLYRVTDEYGPNYPLEYKSLWWGGGKGSFTLTTPMEAGDYAVRMFTYGPTLLAEALFTAESATYFDMREDTFDAGSPLRAIYFTDFLSGDAWVGIVPADAPEEEPLAREQALDRTPAEIHETSVHMFTAPEEPGGYELRIYSSETEGRLMAVHPFQVEDRGHTLAIGMGGIEKNGYVRVRFTASQGLPDDAWVGLMPAATLHGDESYADDMATDRKFLQGRLAGELAFPTPTEDGDYQVRMYSTDLGGRELAMVAFRIKDGEGRVLKPEEIEEAEQEAEEPAETDGDNATEPEPLAEGAAPNYQIPPLPGVSAEGGWGGNTLRLGQNTMYPGVEMNIEFARDPATPAWIGIFSVGSYFSDVDQSGIVPGTAIHYPGDRTQGAVVLAAPTQMGMYDLCMYSLEDNELLAQIPFGVIIPGNTISLDRNEFAPGEAVRFYFTSLPMNPDAAIVLVPKGLPPDADIWSQDVDVQFLGLAGESGGYREINAPAEPGEYELRMLPDGRNPTPLFSAPFTVR